MTSYLRSWFYGGPSPDADVPPTIERISPPPDLEVSDDDDNDDGEATETERDYHDTPPAFPAFNSAQRASAIPTILTDSQLMPPPPVPPSSSLAVRKPGVVKGNNNNNNNMLAVPLRTVKPPVKPSRKREKVALAPGYGPLDWAALKSSGVDLRGVDTLMRVPPSMLKKHDKADDAWSSFNGKVYNITPYLKYHPGGEKELMRVAGRDGTKLFALTHAWVNAEFMLDSCLVGFLIPEPT